MQLSRAQIQKLYINVCNYLHCCCRLFRTIIAIHERARFRIRMSASAENGEAHLITMYMIIIIYNRYRAFRYQLKAGDLKDFGWITIKSRSLACLTVYYYYHYYHYQCSREIKEEDLKKKKTRTKTNIMIVYTVVLYFQLVDRIGITISTVESFNPATFSLNHCAAQTITHITSCIYILYVV